ncbi:hypothetical protein RB213_014781 [Colletotrichum asianum]
MGNRIGSRREASFGYGYTHQPPPSRRFPDSTPDIRSHRRTSPAERDIGSGCFAPAATGRLASCFGGLDGAMTTLYSLMVSGDRMKKTRRKKGCIPYAQQQILALLYLGSGRVDGIVRWLGDPMLSGAFSADPSLTRPRRTWGDTNGCVGSSGLSQSQSARPQDWRKT